MQCLVILALVSVATAQQFVPQELPEVAAARSAHLAEVARAAARVGVLNYPFPAQVFAAPAPTGFQSETAEVAAARARHLAEHARQSGVAAPAVVPTFRELFPRSF